MFIEKFDKVSINEIVNFEKENKIKLPENYKFFLMNVNGGFMKENYFYLGNEIYSIEVLYGMQKKYSMYDVSNLATSNLIGNYKNDIILIGQCIGDNYIGLKINNNSSNVYYVDVMNYLSTGKSTDIKYINISDNFNSFIENLIIKKEI